MGKQTVINEAANEIINSNVSQDTTPAANSETKNNNNNNNNNNRNQKQQEPRWTEGKNGSGKKPYN